VETKFSFTAKKNHAKTYEKNPPIMVIKIMYTKNDVEIGGVGKTAIVNIATIAIANLPQNAQIHGLSGLSP